MRFPISYGRTAPLLIATGMPKRSAYIDIDDTTVTVRMGFWFTAEIDRTAIKHVEHDDRKYLSIGVHGWAGRWLVNGEADGFVKITIEPTGSAKVGPVTVKLRQLVVSLEDPDGFVELFN